MPLSPALQGDKTISSFRRQLLHWYVRNRRELPWRGERDPYRIWVSEVMLQQTRVSVVADRYSRFLRRFPDLKRLAASPLSQVLAEWSGLGYYRRARNLHAAARKIVALKEPFPRRAAQLQELPGIGRYTAAAIASIAFQEPVAVVDGNVERVLRRLLAPASPNCWHTAEELLDPGRPGDFNQAMMELGATVCLPGQPNCSRCPVADFCGLKNGVKMPKLPASKSRKRRIVFYGLALKRGRVFLVRRNQTDSLMAGMWELPSSQRKRPALFQLRHSITDTDYQVFVTLVVEGRTPATGKWFHPEQLSKVPITGLTRKILKRAGVLGHRS